MRKIILFTLCSILTLLTSCKKSDEVKQVVEEKKTLVLTPSLNEVEVGNTITFKVTANKNNIEDAQITLVKGGPIKGYSWAATKEGNYKFFASKAGYLNSEEVEVRVMAPISKDIAQVEFNNDVFTIDNPRLKLEYITWSNNVTKDKKVTKWVLEGENKEREKSIAFYFETPALKVGGGEFDYEYVWPNEDNIDNVKAIIRYKKDNGVDTWEYNEKGLYASYKTIEKVSESILKVKFIASSPIGKQPEIKLYLFGNLTFINELQILKKEL